MAGHRGPTLTPLFPSLKVEEAVTVTFWGHCELQKESGPPWVRNRDCSPAHSGAQVCSALPVQEGKGDVTEVVTDTSWALSASPHILSYSRCFCAKADFTGSPCAPGEPSQGFIGQCYRGTGDTLGTVSPNQKPVLLALSPSF
jgi:hypothetical protein